MDQNNKLEEAKEKALSWVVLQSLRIILCGTITSQDPIHITL